jgi:hypothetical protein
VGKFLSSNPHILDLTSPTRDEHLIVRSVSDEEETFSNLVADVAGKFLSMDADHVPPVAGAVVIKLFSLLSLLLWSLIFASKAKSLH